MGILRMVLVAGLVTGLITASASARDGTPGTARAVGYAALLPAGAQGGVSAASTGTGLRSAGVVGLRPAGGGSVAGVEVRVGASDEGARASAQGTIEARGITLLDGRVVIAGLRMSARSTARPGAAAADTVQGDVQGLVVDGTPVAAGPGARVDVPGIGTLVVLEQVSDASGGVRANALRLEVSDPQAAGLIGRPFVIGHLDLTTTAGTPGAPAPAAGPRRAPRTAPSAPAIVSEPPSAAPSDRPGPAPALTAPSPLGLPRRAAPALPLAPGGSYVFPVFGDGSFSDDYGAPRAGTGWHHGNDIFAPTGTPILAVADGTLGRVGVNTLGGNRLWLTDDAGNQFYYAHLSAYAPAAVQGARVRAGQVIGFVGNTGQAITTPPHLHFEVHPGGGDSVDPYPYLVAWRRGTQIPLAFRQAAASPSPAPSVGAVLVDDTPESDVAPAPGDGLATPAY